MENERRFRRAALLIAFLIVAVVFGYLIREFLVPLFLAVIFSSLAQPMYKWFSLRFHGRRRTAAAVTLILLILGVVVPLVILLGMIADQALTLSENMVPWIKEQLEGAQRGRLQVPDWVPFEKEIEHTRITTKVGQLADSVGAVLMGSLAAISKGTAEFFLDLFVMLYAMYTFFLHGGELKAKASGTIPLPEAVKNRLLNKGKSVARATIKGTIVIGFIQGALGGLAFHVAGLQGAALWGAVMAVASVIPAIGTALVWIPACAYLLLSGQTEWALGLLAWFALVVGSVDNILRPWLVGTDTQLPDLLILVSTLGGLTLFGMAGLIIGPMLAAAFMIMLEAYQISFQDELDQ